MKWLAAIVLLFVGAISLAQPTNAIILIRHEAVSRAISPDAYNHDLWIRWPLSSSTNGSNRLLAITTRNDWNTPDSYLSFKEAPARPGQAFAKFASPVASDMESRGILAKRKRTLYGTNTYVVRRPNGFVSAESLLLGLSASTVDAHPFDNKFPAGSLVLYGAESWDDAEEVARKCDGQAIIIEYPPEPGRYVSAAWLQGMKGVPSDVFTHVKGLIPAEEVVPLLEFPGAFQDGGPVTGDDAQRWMQAILFWKPIELSLTFVLGLLASAAALWSIASDKGSRWARIGIGLVLGILPCLLVAGNLAMITGLRAWAILPFLAYLGIGMVSAPLLLGLRAAWPSTHPLFGLALVISAITLVGNPLRTIMSEVFTPTPQLVSPVAAGILIAAATASVSFSVQSGLAARITGALPAVAMMVFGAYTHAWWSEYPPLLLAPLLAVLAGAGCMSVYYLPAFLLWPFLANPWNGQLAWDYGGLLYKYSDLHAINAAGQMEFLLSPGWLATLTGFVLAILFGGRYSRHQIRRTFLARQSSRALFWAALATACMGIRDPFMLTAALIVLQAALLVLLFDAAGTL